MNISIMPIKSYNHIWGDSMSATPIQIKKRGEDGYKLISVRLRENTLAKIDSLAAQSNRSRNEIINILLENSVDNAELN